MDQLGCCRTVSDGRTQEDHGPADADRLSEQERKDGHVRRLDVRVRDRHTAMVARQDLDRMSKTTRGRTGR